jgi:hypothetical protein
LFEENAPEYGGLYVLELTEGGAAATSGALEPNDQLVSIAGNAAIGPDASFDNVMDALGATESPAKLKFFRGSAAELAAANAPAASAAAAPKSDRTALTVMQAGAATEIKVPGGKLLRNVLLENKVNHRTPFSSSVHSGIYTMLVLLSLLFSRETSPFSPCLFFTGSLCDYLDLH